MILHSAFSPHCHSSHDMLNEAVRTIHQAVIKRLRDHEALTRSALEDSDLPAPLREYLDGMLAREAERVADTIKARRDPWVAESVDVSRARTALAVAASRNVMIPTPERESVLEQATGTTVRYLVRPARTLVEMIFEDDSDEIGVDDVADRMALLPAYSYFDDVLKHYFEEKDIERVDRARLDAVLHRVDRQMTSDFSVDEWVHVMEPLFETFAISEKYANGVPAGVLRMYFTEKQAGTALEQLEALGDADLVSRDRLHSVLQQPVAEPDPEPEPAFSKRPASALPEAPAPSLPVKQDEGPQPLWKQFQSRPAASAQPPPPRNEERPTRHADPSGNAAPLWQQYRSQPDPAPASTPQHITRDPAPSRDHRPSGRERIDEPDRPASIDELEQTVLGPRGRKNRKMFVRQLFGGDDAAYRSALSGIAQMTSWSKASQFIAREVFRKHDVNIYDDAAIAFTDLVEDRFAQHHRG